VSTLVKYPTSYYNKGSIVTLFGGIWIYDNNLLSCRYESSGTVESRLFVKFSNVTVPPGAVINSVKFSMWLYGYETDNDVYTRVYFEKALNPTAISSVYDYNSRSLTTAYVSKDFTSPGDYTDIAATDWTGLKTAFEEIIGQTGWASGNSVQLLMKAYSPSNDGIWGDLTLSKTYLTIDYTYTAPDAPTSISITRNSDTSHTVGWTNNPGSGKPYVSIRLQRSSDGGVSYSTISSTISPTATSYIDTTTVADQKYIYRVQAYNDAGYSASLTASEIKTTPDAPTDVVALRNSSSSVTITWTNNALTADNMCIERYDGASWSTVDLSMAGDAVSKTDTSATTATQYRVWAKVTYGTLASAKVESNTIVAGLSAPNKPTNLVPNTAGVIDIGIANTFSWQHNSTDTSTQTNYQLLIRIDGGTYGGASSFDSGKVASTNQYASLQNGVGGLTLASDTLYYWKVRTYGADTSSPSDYSDEVSFEVKTKPTGTITSPGDGSTYGYSALTLSWTYNQVDSDTQVEAIAILSDNVGVLETQNVYDNSTSILFDYDLENGVAYSVTLQVKASNGLWSAIATSNFTTSFYVPPQPILTAVYNDLGGYCSLSINNPVPTGSEVDASYNKIYRSVDGGVTYELIEDNASTNSTVIDYRPLLNGTTKYYAVAVSTIPSTTLGYITELVLDLTGVFFLNSGNNYSTYLRIIGDVKYTEGRNRDQVLKKFEGRVYPVKFMGDRIDQEINFSCDLPYTDYDTMIDIIENDNNIFYRDWKSRWFSCAIDSPQFALNKQAGYIFTCKLIRLEEDYS
jgi:hypothetical protein